MENIFKKLVYTSVGIAAQAKEKLESTITNLVEEEKISTQEGKRIVDEFLQSTDSKKENVENEVNGLVEKIVKTFSFATQSEMKELEDRIAALEALIAAMDEKVEAEPETETETETEKKPAPKRRATRAKKEEAPKDEEAEK